MGSVALVFRAGLRHRWRATLGLALLIGLPLGLLAGRWAWSLFATFLGVSGTAVIPVPLVVLAIAATWLLALLIAVVPSQTAARISPAATLRAE